MSVPLAAAQLLGARTLRRLLGCGCATAAAVIALPVLVLLSAMNGFIPGSGSAGANQLDAAAGTLIGAAEPLPVGRFTVSQGFGCTAVATESSPPAGYTCPPDGAHSAFVYFHTGIDLAAPSGVPVFAVVAGTVHVVRSQGGSGCTSGWSRRHRRRSRSRTCTDTSALSACLTATPSAPVSRSELWAAPATAPAPTFTSRSTSGACPSTRAQPFRRDTWSQRESPPPVAWPGRCSRPRTRGAGAPVVTRHMVAA